MANGWKITAIIFIVLFIIETCFIIYAINIGVDSIDGEYECSINVCADEIYDAYQYYSYDGICDCYTDGEIVKTQYIK